VALVAVALVVPILRWSELPQDRPGGWLLVAMVFVIGGLLVMAPQMWKPRGWVADRWDGLPAHWIGPSGLAMGWLRSHYGPVAVGSYALAFGAGLSVVTTVASAHSSTWRVSFAGITASFVGAVAIGASAGAVVRRFGRLVDTRGQYVPRGTPHGVSG
jgi:hypothetical protein